MRRLFFVMLLIGLGACGGEAPPSATQAPPSATTAPTADASGLAARVNGVGISQEEFQRALTRNSADTTIADTNALAAQTLETLIEQELINQGAAELGIRVNDEDVAAVIADLRQVNATSDAEWQNWLALNQYTEAELRAELYDQVLTQRVIEQFSARFVGNVPQVRARHILVQTEDAALAVLNRLNNGEDFALVAAQTSLDTTTRENGGDLGWFAHDELTDGVLTDVAFNLRPGQIAGPVPTSLGYHIIQVLEVAERPVEPERLTILVQNTFNNWLTALKQKATIERFQ